MTDSPSTTDPNGRDSRGRFAAGNRAAKGNPHARSVARLRALVLESVSEADMRAIVAKLVDLAKGGDLAAIREVLDRAIGKPVTPIAIDSEPATPKLGVWITSPSDRAGPPAIDAA